MNRFKTLSSCALAVLVLTQCSDTKDKPGTELTAEKKESAENWTPLLDESDASEWWRNYKKDDLNPKWEVKDGVMTLTEKGGGDIVTKEQFGSFEMVLEYNISPEGNSGLMYHVTEEEERPWQTGPEIQIQDNIGGHDPQKSGWLYQFYEAETDATKPAGEWNELRILITPEKCVHWMNGTKYVEYVKGSDDWNQRYEASKFVEFPKFGKASKGHICLQDHGNIVSFRNIKIREVE